MNHNVWHQVQFWVAVWLHLNMFLVGIFDLYAAFRYGPTGTVSYQIWEWSRRMPVLPFAAGVLAGHLFWRSYEP